MDKPVLVIMAAGMGSRYGGLKQMDSMDKEGHRIIDFSIYAAKEAGFEKVVFIIKHAIEEDFKKLVVEPISRHMETECVFQELDKIPAGYSIPEGREKPWGTTHAISCCKGVVNGPFMVINADDYYGKEGFKIMYKFLTETAEDTSQYAMVAYELGKTLTEKGSVTRGVCKKDAAGNLEDIVEQKTIVMTENGAAYSEDDGATFKDIDVKTPVSMNMWGFKKGFIDELETAFKRFLDEDVAGNPLKAEALLPSDVDRLIKSGKATVKVFTTPDKWFGVTYQEDKPYVVSNIQALKDAGEYPAVLWP